MWGSMFTCYPPHCYENLIAVDQGIRSRQLEKFKRSKKNFSVLDKISDYADKNIESLLARFLECSQDLDQLKSFCEDVL